MRHTLKNTVLVYSDFDSETRIIVTIPQHILQSSDIAELDFQILMAIQTVLECTDRETANPIKRLRTPH